MKGVARLTLFYLATFVFFLGASAVFSVVRGWALAASAVSSQPFSALAVVLSALSAATSLAVYASVLSSFTYSSRHGIGGVLSALLIFVLSSAALFSIAYGQSRLPVDRLAAMGQASSPVSAMQEAAIARFENGGAIAFAGSVAVIASPGAPLRIADASEGPEYGLRSERIDPFAPSLAVSPSLLALRTVFSSAGRHLQEAAGAGVLPLLAYAAALSFLLASFRFLAGRTRWPLADFVLCAVVFLGVAAFEDFLFSAVVRRLISTLVFALPDAYAVPVVLTAAGTAVAFCAGLAAVAGGWRKGNV